MAASLAFIAPAPTAGADDTVEETSSAAKGRGSVAAKAGTAKSTSLATRAMAVADAYPGITLPTSYPSQPQLRVYPDNPTDASDTAGLLGHDDLAPMLMDLMRTSNRISTQVVGQSTEGRDLYLVTVTAPETTDQTAQQTAWRDEIKHDPITAATDTALAAGYKTPIWISANIHGNEWEGTDAAMKYITELATAPWADVKNLLRNNRLYFSVVLNPDGRTIGQRATKLNLDPNRDMITNTTPETRSFIQTVAAIQPMYSADFHGYTSVLQVEPCGPPHGENYEYDLFLPQAYAMALAVENDVVAANIPGNTYYNTTTGQVVSANTSADTAHIKIPYRDTASGWDDYPPIFTAQYAAFFGASTSTVELPKSRALNGGTRQSPENAVINVAVAKQTMKTMATYFNANRANFLANQIENFRRAVVGQAKTQVTLDNIASISGPSQWKALWDVADNQDPVVLPRAYVIPMGSGQRSESDAISLVKQLMLHDIEVSTLDADTTIDGVTYPAGSFVIDMHQPMRGLINSLLDLGTDISAKVPSMYDISAWSLSYLWGADVAKVGLVTDASIGAISPVTEVPTNASITDEADYVTFELAGVNDYVALNNLLEDGAEISLLPDGSAIVDPDSIALATEAADEFGIEFDEATPAEIAELGTPAVKGLDDLTIGYVGSQDDLLSLSQLGFDDLVSLSATAIQTDPTVLDPIDVLWIGSTLSTSNAGVLSAMQGYVASGRSIVGRGTAALNLEKTLGLVNATTVSGWGSGNGIVKVATPADSVLAPYAQDYSFIYPAYTFTGLGEGTKVEQAYASYGSTGKTLMAGHWRSTTATNGPDYFVGLPSVISGTASSGAKGMVFGTSVVYRTMTKGGFSQVGRSLFWAAKPGTGASAPASTSVAVTAPASVTYPGTVSLDVAVSAGAGTPTGLVEVFDATSTSVGTAVLSGGTATVEISGLTPGISGFTVSYLSDDAHFAESTSEPVSVTVAKASSSVSLTAVAKKKGAVKLKITATAAGVTPTGSVKIIQDGWTVKTVTLNAAGKATITLKPGKGKHSYSVVYGGSSLVTGSVSAKAVVKLK